MEQLADHRDPWAPLAAMRWPNGFLCPRCGHCEGTRLRTRPSVWQCRQCRRQTSVTAGTALHRCRIGPQRLCRALDLVAAGGPSARRLERELDVAYDTAWTLLQKVRRSLDEQPALVGHVNATVASLANGPLRGPGSTMSVAVVVAHDGKTASVTSDEAPREVVARALEPCSGFVETDVLPPTVRELVPRPGVVREALRAATERARVVVHSISGWLTRTFRGVSRKYLRRYVDEAVARRNGVSIHQRVLRAPFTSLRALRASP